MSIFERHHSFHLSFQIQFDVLAKNPINLRDRVNKNKRGEMIFIQKCTFAVLLKKVKVKARICITITEIAET